VASSLKVGCTVEVKTTICVELVKSFGKNDDHPDDQIFILRRTDNKKIMAASGQLNGYAPDYTMAITDTINDVEFARLMRLVAAGKACGFQLGDKPITYVPGWTLMIACIEICDKPLELLETWVKAYVKNGMKPPVPVKKKPKAKRTTPKKK
jgi:hypothetical protein